VRNFEVLDENLVNVAERGCTLFRVVYPFPREAGRFEIDGTIPSGH
jgi:hypothetical protein